MRVGGISPKLNTLNPPNFSYADLEQHNVAVTEDVITSLNSVMSRFARAGHRTEFDEVFPVHRFGFDESAFEVSMNRAGGFHGGVPGMNGPGANFFIIESEKGPQAEQGIGAVDKGIHSRFGQAEAFDIFLRFFRRKIGQI